MVSSNIVYPSSTLAIAHFRLSTFDIIKGLVGYAKTTVAESLFGSGSFNIDCRLVTPADSLLRPCAVDEFEYDFTGPNPLQWDFQKYVLAGADTYNGNSGELNNTYLPGAPPKYQQLHHTAPSEHDDLHTDFNHLVQQQQDKKDTLPLLQQQQQQQHIYQDPSASIEKTAQSKQPHFEEDEGLSSGEENDDDDDYYGNEYALDDELSMSFARFHSQSSSNNSTSSFQSAEATQSSILKRKYIDTLDVSPASGSDNIDTPVIPKKTVIPDQAFADDESKLADTTKSSAATPQSADAHGQYVCPVCNVTLKMKTYLKRHMKKHEDSRPFKCPFHAASAAECQTQEANNMGTICHATGGFTRRDSCIIHLKAIHFVYPAGIRSQDRSRSSGRCAGCFQEFTNNTEWLKNHVFKNDCPAIVARCKWSYRS